MLLVALAFAAATATTDFPSASAVAWMHPDAFHLRVGMRTEKALEVLRRDGWVAEKGKAPGEYAIAYTDEKRVSLTFTGGKLRSIRFELVGFIPKLKAAFDEERVILRKALGAPRPGSPATTLIYEKSSPNVIAILSTDPKTDFGKQGLGFLVVRYFEPPPR